MSPGRCERAPQVQDPPGCVSDPTAVGDVTKITEPDGSYFTYTFDNARRLTKVTGRDRETISYTYNLFGNKTAEMIKSSSAAIVFSQAQTFEELGRLLKNIGANSQTPSQIADAAPIWLC